MSDHRARDRKATLGRERMAVARRFLIDDRNNREWFDAAAMAGEPGIYMVKNWDARCRIAMHNDGLLLAEDEQWAVYKRELEHWPSLLWINLLQTSEGLEMARKCYQRGLGKMAMTTRTLSGISIAPITWVPRGLRKASQLEILAWTGVVGGELPPLTDYAPKLAVQIGDIRSVARGTATIIDLTSTFTALGALTFTAVSSDTNVVTAVVNGAMLTVTPLIAGTATITVRATEPGMLYAEQDFMMTVANPS